MKAKQFIAFCLFLLCAFAVQAQDKAVHGRVTGADGAPLYGVTVSVKKSNKAVITDENGDYSIAAAPGSVLLFSYVGYAAREATVQSGEALNITLQSSDTELSTVVVTALGIQRKAKSLTYSTQIVKGDDLTKAKDANPMNNLIGKVSGLQINRSSSGIGGSVNITLRGLKSLRNNQPLYVVDGLPIINVAGSGSEGPFGGSTDRGDILSTLNSDDILSINVLKGASASALYGSEGANGAIMITTKKGAAGSTRVDISSSATFDQPFYLPKLQYSYGQSASEKGDAEESWGAKGNFKNHVDGFFRTGTTLINSVAISGGNAKAQNYFSYANTANKGILPTNKFNQHTLSFRNTMKLFNDKLTFDGNIMYSSQNIENRPTSGLYFNVLSGLYMFPRGLDFDYYKENYQYLSPTRNLMLQNWYEINFDKGLSGTHHEQNPFWALYKNPTFQSRHNIIAAVNLKYAINDWLSLSARGTMNRIWNKFERKVYAGTQGVISGQTSVDLPVDNGRYLRDESNGVNKYGDILLIGNKDLNENLTLNFTAGASINDLTNNGWSLDARKLVAANAFLMDGIFRGEKNSIASLTENYSRVQKQGVFGSANLGFKEMAYLDLTARNDWSSSLAYTPNEKSGYFYYSAGLSLVLSEMFKLPTWNNLSKLRFTYAKVGNDIAQFVSVTPQGRINNGAILPNSSGVLNDDFLKPEISTSFEAGYEGRFLNSRLGLDIALYKSNTVNQYVSFNGPPALLYSTLYMNAGNVENKGIEIAVNYDVIKGEGFNWTSGVNYTANRNKVLELHPQLGNRYPIGNFNVLRLGGSFGDYWAKTFKRNDQGKIVVADDGTPMGDVDGYIGSSNPKAMIGWNNSFSYKRFALSMNVDGRFGGQVISITQGYLNSFGYSKESADARDAGGVVVDAVKQDGTPVTKVDAQKWYSGIGNRDGIIEGEVYSATNIRLRELSIAYNIPVKSSFVKQANVSLIGRNLFFFKNNAPFDPELNTSTGVVGQGFDSFGLPTTRSYGLNVKLSF
ncbi:SusC/RagA family TonB-linked outer membrane protein [Niabella sp. CC-SYL272]|uniref:SusC/RagA family TonB-linked outer membrane protein n=1 Tax=Niabella agricola TaxID=2891571 RepID=UPI001F2C8D92|nr:SusC/RagA family TonB-linked outer membrane protein [Niabella agricola]MCF3112182.1 SusC/RagA family TonB-linked outer membrane protein [Niabella agricola]